MRLQLGDHGCEIAMEGKSGVCGVGAESGGIDVDLDEFGARVPFGWGAKVEDPIQAGAKEENDVCFFESGAPGAGGV